MPLGNAASQEHRHTILWVSLLASAVSVATVVARVVYSGQGTYVFLIWNLILLVIGVTVVTRLSRRKAVLLTLGVWLLLTALGLVPALVGSLFARQFGGF